MQKRLLYFCVCMLCLFTCCTASAAARVTDVNWGVDRNNVLRFVIDTSEKTGYEVEVKGKELTIMVNALADSKVMRQGTVKSDMAKSYRADYNKRKTVITVPLTKAITPDQYKTFTLKKDARTGRPERIVVDITANKRAGTVRTSSRSTAPLPKANYKTGGGIKGKVIVIDPGHGGTDPGAIGLHGTKEKDCTLAISKALEVALKKAGAEVHMSRTTDVDVWGPDATDVQELQARVDASTRHKADAFISVHINANNNRSVGGLTTYYYPKTSYDAKLARNIQNSMAQSFSLYSYGIRQANFYVIKRSYMPAVLAEICFISNPKEEQLLSNTWFRNKVAHSISEGIIKYFE